MSDDARSAMGAGFGKFVPGFEFLQNLAGQGDAGKAPGMAPLSSLGNWVAPTFNVEDLEKRIQELKAVQFWLDQNAKALAATIQAMEVQKMTLATLKTMNLSMGDVAQSLGAMVGLGGAGAGSELASAPAPSAFAGLEIPPRTYGTPPGAPAPEADEADEAETDAESGAAPDQPTGTSSTRAASPGGSAIDPMQWWGALTQQFQQIASTALQDASRQMVPGSGDSPFDASLAGGSTAVAPQARKRAAPPAAGQPARARKAPPRKTPAKQASAAQAVPSTGSRKHSAPPSLATGDWPMPTAFFQMPGFPSVGEPDSKKKPAPAKAASTRSAKSTGTKPAPKKSTSRKAAPASRRR